MIITLSVYVASFEFSVYLEIEFRPKFKLIGACLNKHISANFGVGEKNIPALFKILLFQIKVEILYGQKKFANIFYNFSK